MAAIVLAGGASRRMGRDKAEMLLAGRSMLERAVEAVSAASQPVFVVAESAEAYRLPHARVLADMHPGEGPVGGILTGLYAAGPGAHLVVACDMPFLNSDLLRHLLSCCEEQAYSSANAAVPRVGGRPEPLCAAYRHTALPGLESYFADGGRAAHAALDRLSVRWVDEPELRSLDPELRTFTNVNTPEEYARLAGS